MSTVISSIVNDASILASDPQFSRVTQSDWLAFYNLASRRLATDLKLVEYEATFTTTTDDLYSMPEDAVQIKAVFYNADPATDPYGYRKLGEMFEDEFQSSTDGAYPDGTPSHYHPRQGYFHLYPRPDSTVTAGGKVQYWGIPADSFDRTANIPFADLMRDVLLLGMLYYGFTKMKLFEDAAAKKAEWDEAMAVSREKMEDRSVDRRTRLRVATSGATRQH